MTRSEDLTFDFAELPAPLRYKLLVGLVVPRPIALVSSQDAEGQLNAAPFSFFNVFSEAPPLVVLGIDGRDGTHKDSARNIERQGEFVVNLVDETLLDAMTVCAVDMPPEYDEFEEAGLTSCASRYVLAPGITEAPARLECRLFQWMPVGDAGRTLILGEVMGVSVREGIIDPETHRTDIDRLGLVGRLHGAGNYLRLTDRVIQPRISVADWMARRK